MYVILSTSLFLIGIKVVQKLASLIVLHVLSSTASTYYNGVAIDTHLSIANMR